MTDLPSTESLLKVARRKAWRSTFLVLLVACALTVIAYTNRANGSVVGWSLLAFGAWITAPYWFGLVCDDVDEQALDWKPAEAELLETQMVREYRTRYGIRGPFANIRLRVLPESIPANFPKFYAGCYAWTAEEIHCSAVAAPVHPWKVNAAGHALIPIEVALTRRTKNLRVRLPFANYMNNVPLENIAPEDRLWARPVS